jgi:hypothetical protein
MVGIHFDPSNSLDRPFLWFVYHLKLNQLATTVCLEILHTLAFDHGYYHLKVSIVHRIQLQINGLESKLLHAGSLSKRHLCFCAAIFIISNYGWYYLYPGLVLTFFFVCTWQREKTRVWHEEALEEDRKGCPGLGSIFCVICQKAKYLFTELCCFVL